jgi:hypothetical protein
MWAKAPEGFPARSTVRASKLGSRLGGACGAGSGAHPTEKKAPVAYERISDAVVQYTYGLIPVDAALMCAW